MELEDEILTRIRSAKVGTRAAELTDFQFRAGENGSVLINLKTGRAQLIYDEDSNLHDLEDLGLAPKDSIRPSGSRAQRTKAKGEG